MTNAQSNTNAYAYADADAVMPVGAGAGSPSFIVTKEHHRFAKFCDACRRERYIGLCHGAPGVGKTFSAHYYSKGKGTADGPADSPNENEGFPILYTPPVANNPRQIAKDVRRLREAGRYRGRVERTREEGRLMWPPPDRTELLIIDEADRLKMAGLE